MRNETRKEEDMRVLNRIQAVIGIAFLCLVLAVAAPNVAILVAENDRILDVDQVCEFGETYDAIMVLGASINPDGTPSSVLQDRLDVAIRLYQSGVSQNIIVSGDDESDADYDEVTAMKNYIVGMGVPSQDVFCDHAGICTYDSMYRAQYVFNVNTMVVVTQSYHLPRALFDANALGVSSVGVASDLHSYTELSFFHGREVFARVSDFIKVITRRDATYLSEPVSLSQSGDVTSW